MMTLDQNLLNYALDTFKFNNITPLTKIFIKYNVIDGMVIMNAWCGAFLNGEAVVWTLIADQDGSEDLLHEISYGFDKDGVLIRKLYND